MVQYRSPWLPTTKTKPQRIRELQLEHLKLLKLIDNSCLGLPSRKKLLPPASSLYCVQLNPVAAQAWTEMQMDEFEGRCQWERNVRSDFIYGAKPLRDTAKHHNPYLKLATLVTELVRSPEIDRKAEERNRIISPIATRLHEKSPAIENKQAARPMSAIQEETPEKSKWFQLPGKKRILEIKSAKKPTTESLHPAKPSTPSPPSPRLPFTPPTQILPNNVVNVVSEHTANQANGSELDKRWQKAWSADRSTPETTDRRANWNSQDAPDYLQDSPPSRQNGKTAARKGVPSTDGDIVHLATQLNTSLILQSPPPKTEQELAREEYRRRTQLMRERYVPIKMFDMMHRQNGKGPDDEVDDEWL